MARTAHQVVLAVIGSLGLGSLTAWAQQPQAVQDSAAIGVSIGSGARALGMGGAFIAVADDGTAASWNPAGVAVLEKPEISLVWKARDRQTVDAAPSIFIQDYSFTFGDPEAGYFSRDDTHSEDQSFGYWDRLSASGLDFVSLACPFRWGRVKLVPQLNYQKAIELGYDRRPERPSTSTGVGFEHFEQTYLGQHTSQDFLVSNSFEATGSEKRSGSLDLWAASLGVNPHPKLFLGVSLNWWRHGSTGQGTGDFRLAFCSGEVGAFDTSCFNYSSDYRFGDQSNYAGFNVNLGLLWKPLKKLGVGLVFKTPFNMKVDGVSASSFRSVNQDETSTNHSNGVGGGEERGEIRWPRTLGIGFAFLPRETLTLALDFSHTRWSKARYRFDGAESSVDEDLGPYGQFVFSERTYSQGEVLWPTLLKPEGFGRRQDDQEQFRRQLDTWQARAGIEYIVFGKGLTFPLRAGGFVDRQYFTDLQGHQVFNLGWTAGAGVVWKHLAVDAAYVHQSLGYSLGIVLVTPELSTTRLEQRPSRDDRFYGDKIYVSTIVRF